MRKEYSTALRKEFVRLIKGKIPQFEEFKLKSYYLWPGERAFRWVPVDGLHCFIILSPNPKGLDEFMIELAWSKRSRFPELSMRPTGIPTIDHVEFERDEFDVTLSSICPNPEISWSINKIDFLQAEEREFFELIGSRCKSAVWEGSENFKLEISPIWFDREFVD